MLFAGTRTVGTVVAGGLALLAVTAVAGGLAVVVGTASAASNTAEQALLKLMRQDQPYSLVAPEVFDSLGWDLPDGGERVRALARFAPGGAFDPAALERVDPTRVGYRARWISHRYRHYGLEWDITALKLEPLAPEPGLPTVAIINGGAANWYEFFVDPMNDPGVGQFLAQRVPVLLITIPGNYRPGGWPEPIPLRQPRYLLDQELGEKELAARNAMFTFTLITEGVAQLIDKEVAGRLLIAGHSTGGEIQFLLKDRLRERLQGLSLGWGTGGPARVRQEWDKAREGAVQARYPASSRLRYRDPAGYVDNYVGPLNPVPGTSPREVAEAWFAQENRRRPQFKQVIQDIEHRGDTELLPSMREELRRVVAEAGLSVDIDRVAADYFSTMRTEITGYRRIISNSGSLDEGHWHKDPQKAREVSLAARFREANPKAQVRVMAYATPMTHYGHIERPRQLAGALLAAVRWLMEDQSRVSPGAGS